MSHRPGAVGSGSGGPGSDLPDSARLALLVAVVATVVLYAVPWGRYLVYPLLLLSTLAHEMGHGIAALLVGGSFHSFRMWPDGSGVAYWSLETSRGGEPGGLRLALVAAGGLVGPALVAAVGFVLGRSGRTARRSLVVTSLVLVVCLLLVVRGMFAWVFVAILAAGLALVGRRASEDLAQTVLLFLSLQLALSVFSRGDYLFTAQADTASGPMPSDVAYMADALFMPYWFWGAVCGAFSVGVLVLGLGAFWRRGSWRPEGVARRRTR